MPHLIQSSTKDVRLFAAIAAMGIPWEQESGGSAAVSQGERVWLFGNISDCGKWTIKDLLAWWRQADFHMQNPDHPFTVVKACMASGAGLKRYITRGGGIRQRKVGGSFIIEQIEGDSATLPTLRSTDDTSFVAALSAVGFDAWTTTAPASRRIFGIGERSLSRGYEYAHARTWWMDKAFEGHNPQHPFAYAKAVAITYNSAVDAIVRDRPLVRWSPKGSHGVAYIHPDCSTETEEIIARKLAGK